jgi:hypothetical protein
MNGAKNLWFTYEPIPHSDKGYIYCEGPIQLTARVTKFNNGNEFSIEYEGQKNEEIESVLKQMNEWFFYTHIKDADDNEF